MAYNTTRGVADQVFMTGQASAATDLGHANSLCALAREQEGCLDLVVRKLLVR